MRPPGDDFDVSGLFGPMPHGGRRMDVCVCVCMCCVAELAVRKVGDACASETQTGICLTLTLLSSLLGRQLGSELDQGARVSTVSTEFVPLSSIP